VALLFQVCFGWLVRARQAETTPLSEAIAMGFTFVKSDS